MLGARSLGPMYPVVTCQYRSHSKPTMRATHRIAVLISFDVDCRHLALRFRRKVLAVLHEVLERPQIASEAHDHQRLSASMIVRIQASCVFAEYRKVTALEHERPATKPEPVRAERGEVLDGRRFLIVVAFSELLAFASAGVRVRIHDTVVAGACGLCGDEAAALRDNMCGHEGENFVIQALIGCYGYSRDAVLQDQRFVDDFPVLELLDLFASGHGR